MKLGDRRPVGALRAYRLPANDELERLSWIDALWDGLSERDRREAATRYLRAQLGLLQGWLDAGYDRRTPIVRTISERVRVLRSTYGLYDLRLSLADRVRVSRESIRDTEAAIDRLLRDGADDAALRRMREALTNQRAALARRLDRL